MDLARSLVAACASVVLVSGCASNQVWHHPGKTSQQFHGDSAQCQAIAGQAGGANPQIQPVPGSGAMAGGFAQGWNQASAVGAAGASQSAFRSCMIGQGWRLVDPESVPASTATAPSAASDDQEILDAIDANPPLRDWMENDPARWNMAVAVDERLRQDPAFEEISMEDRFSMVVETVQNVVEEGGDAVLRAFEGGIPGE